MTRVLIQRMQARRSARYGRWDEAFRLLDPKDQATLGPHRGRTNADALARKLEDKKKECDSKRWTLFRRNDGTEVKLRDVLEKVVSWVRRFEAIGDTAVQFDPVHAALPWAAVKFLIEITVSDFETYARVADGLEIVSRIIVQVAELEKPLSGGGSLKTELSRKIVELYVKVLKFLATARRFFERSHGVQKVKVIFQGVKSTVKELTDGISSMIGDLYRLSNEVRWQDSNTKSEERHDELLSSLKDLMEAFTKPHRARLRSWLAPTFTEDARKEALALRHASTCDWVLNLPEFARWDDCDGQTSKILWLHGPAGFGKTVLCARVIDHMEGKSSSYGRVLSFFCSGITQERSRPFNILKSWIGQLIAKDDTAVEIAVEDGRIQQELSEGTAVLEADQDYLWSLLGKMIKETARCTLVIDGYDECIDAHRKISKYHGQSCRIDFLEKLSTAISGTGTRVLLVSRNQPDLYMAINEFSKDPKLLEVIDRAITKDDTRSDVSSFSKTVFTERMDMKVEKASVIADEAAVKSDGMFLWIALVSKKLHKGATPRHLKKLLKETPSEIHDAYQTELHGILNSEQAVVILKWMLFATRPLTVREMTEALAVSFNDDQSNYPHDDLPDPFTEDEVDRDFVDNYIRIPCGSLIELRKIGEDAPLPSHTIHFVHFSVKEFLLQNLACLSPSAPRAPLSTEITEHEWIGNLCLQYMCYSEFDDTSKNGIKSLAGFLGTYPLFSYTAVSWHDHFCRGKSGDAQSNMSKMVWELFRTVHWKTWAEIFEAHLQGACRDPSGNSPQHPWMRPYGRADSGYMSLEPTEFYDSEDDADTDSDTYSEDNSEDEASPLPVLPSKGKISPTPVYYAAILGLTDVIESLIKARPSDCSLEGGELGTPLQAAVVKSQGPTVELLLGHNADPSQKGGRYGTPLIAAVLLGSDDIFSQLLSACKELDVVDRGGKTALHHACSLGSIEMVEKLVKAGANVNFRSKSGRPPLIRAIAREHAAVVECLLDNGAEAKEKTALFMATQLGNEDITKLLLKHGADPYSRTWTGETALHVACGAGSAPITRMLLEYGAALDARDEDGWTPLHRAAEVNSEECAKLMLAHGASPLDEAVGGLTPFSLALQQRAIAVLDTFNGHESTRATTAASLSARLAAAVESGYVDMAESLLEVSTHLVLGGDLVRDILVLALRTERDTLFNRLSKVILKQWQVDKSIADMPENTTVWTEAEEGMIRGLSWGTEVQKDMVLHSSWRCFPGAKDIVPDAMLPIAVANRSHDVVQLLLQRGANMYRRVSGGRWSSRSSTSSALQLAIIQNSRELVALMLANGRCPIPNSGISLLATLEEAGSRGGMTRKDLTRMLIAHGALDADADTTSASTQGGGKATDGKTTHGGVNEADRDEGVEVEEQAGTGNESDAAMIYHDGEGCVSRDIAWWTDALVGEWEGSYSYGEGARDNEPTAFQIKTVCKESLSTRKKDLNLFDGGGEDTVAEFTIHGQIMSGKVFRFVKLYPSFGWMYEGEMGEIEGGGWRMKGRWARTFGEEPEGYFVVTKRLGV
ncbi:hypothetical protein CEP54_008931 [Fusarium duplospermum]|uniref:NACHT domain-containing protein n=1 Tax=Fusarium duplospermum TaxID=1325734 RepID=A0A428PT25_9HYPO|nr:hypothetical protein CEP54_008931 [Fusarium duplospermum]